jgi:hypothetical protein
MLRVFRRMGGIVKILDHTFHDYSQRFISNLHLH